MSVEVIKNIPHYVEKFEELYLEDRYKARIYALEKKPHNLIVRVNYGGGNSFQIFSLTQTFGVSKTLKRYSSSKSHWKYFVNGGKFYKQQQGKLFPASLRSMEQDALPVFLSKFSWIRFLVENKFEDISFNTIVRYRLYSRDRVLRKIYGCCPEKAFIIHKHRDDFEVLYTIKRFKDNIQNLDNLNEELLLDGDLLKDSITLAYKLNKKVNASWSVRRLREEHDEWSKYYTDLVLEIANEPLNISPVFKALNDITGGIILDTKNLALEGKNMGHCVASYSSVINSGRTAIFHIKGHTAEITVNGNELKLRQFNGVRNISAPPLLRSELEGIISKFNTDNKNMFPVKITEPLFQTFELPF